MSRDTGRRAEAHPLLPYVQAKCHRAFPQRQDPRNGYVEHRRSRTILAQNKQIPAHLQATACANRMRPVLGIATPRMVGLQYDAVPDAAIHSTSLQKPPDHRRGFMLCPFWREELFSQGRIMARTLQAQTQSDPQPKTPNVPVETVS